MIQPHRRVFLIPRDLWLMDASEAMLYYVNGEELQKRAISVLLNINRNPAEIKSAIRPLRDREPEATVTFFPSTNMQSLPIEVTRCTCEPTLWTRGN